MADESDDDTCDQTGENSVQGNQAPEKPEVDFVTGQDNATHNPPVYNEDTPLTSVQSHKRESSVMNSKDSSGNLDNPPANNHPPTEGNTNWRRNVAVGVAAGTAAVAAGAAAVAAAPVVLGAAGFTAGGVAAGSIAAATQSAVYGGYVASGSVFALLQSAGAAGIGVAGNAAIAGITGGITGGITALGARMFTSRTDIKLLICGSGSEAHAFAGIASSVKGTEVRVLTYENAERWNAAMRTSDLKVTFHRMGQEPTSITSKPALVTNDSEVAMQDIDIVAFVLPATGHELFLDAIKRYIKPGTILVGLPGGPGFEFQVHEVLGDVARQCTIVNFESSPWVSRITKFGVKCEVLSTKETLQGAMKKGEGVATKKDPVSTLQNLLGPLPKLNVSSHL